MDNSLLATIRRLPVPVVVALLWACVAGLTWAGRLPKMETLAVVVAAAETMGVLSITLILVAISAAYLIGRFCVETQMRARGWIRGFGSNYVRWDGLDSWLRHRDARSRLIDDCIELHSAFPGLFPRLGFRHPDWYELTDRDRAGLEYALREDLEWAIDSSDSGNLGGTVARRLRRYWYCSAVALPFACLISAVTILAGMDWFVGCVIGVVLWQGLYALAIEDQYEALRLVLQAANRGSIDLHRTADYGQRTFGPPQENYNPHTRDVPTGAVLLDGQS